MSVTSARVFAWSFRTVIAATGAAVSRLSEAQWL